MELNNIPSKGRFGMIANKINGNFDIVRVKIGNLEYQTRKNKGLFADALALSDAIPSPIVGDWALVGGSFPADVYVCVTNGVWVDSGEDYDGDNVSFNDYVLQYDYDLFRNATNNELAELHNENDLQPYIDCAENDFDVRDANGYIIVAFKNGHVKTKYFDSANIEFKDMAIGDNVYDFSIDDEEGNSILVIKNGQIKTKSFNSEKLNFELNEGDYDFSIEDVQGNVIAKFVNGHIKTKYFDSSELITSKYIYCIGDSLTQGQGGINNPRDDIQYSATQNCYPNILQKMIGDDYNVVNLGVGGQTTGEILARCGFLDLIVKTSFTLYGNCTPSVLCSGTQGGALGVPVDSCSEEYANYFMQQGTDAALAQMTLCYINGVLCNLNYSNGNINIRRVEKVSYDMSVPIGSHITFSGNKGDGVYLLRMGTNDVLQNGSNTDVDNYIAKIKQATQKIPNGKFIIMGMFHGYEYTSSQYSIWESMNTKLSKEFGARYIDGQNFIISAEAFGTLNVTPTTDNDISTSRSNAGVKSDVYCIQHGMTPSSFWRSSCTPNNSNVDKIHLNYDGYCLMAKMFYDKMKQLNFI